MKATTLEELRLLSEFIHDGWIVIDEMVFDETLRLFTIPLEKELWDEREPVRGFLLKEVRVPVVRFILRIANAVAVDLVDTEQIGRYNVCELVYVSESSDLVFKTGVPLRLNIKIIGIEITIEESSEASEPVSRRTFFGIGF